VFIEKSGFRNSRIRFGILAGRNFDPSRRLPSTCEEQIFSGYEETGTVEPLSEYTGRGLFFSA